MKFTDLLLSMLRNRIIWTAVASFMLAQLTKAIIASIVNHSWRFDRIKEDGGMPSSHSAFVCSAATMCGWCCGFGTPLFALSVVFAAIVMHDAIGIRRETGKQAVTIRELADALNAQFLEPDEKIRTEKLKVLVGHTPYQIFIGALFGILVAVLSLLIFPVEYATLITF